MAKTGQSLRTTSNDPGGGNHRNRATTRVVRGTARRFSAVPAESVLSDRFVRWVGFIAAVRPPGRDPAITYGSPERQSMTSMPIGDPRFFARSGPHTLAAVATAAAGSAPLSDLLLTGIAPLQTAGPGDVSFLDNRHYAMAMETTRAGAVIVHPDMLARVPAATIPIVTSAPYEGWARVATLFHPEQSMSPGIHPSAVVDALASVDPLAEIGPFAVVEAGVRIGAGCRLGSHVFVGRGVVMGRDCRIGPHASVSHAIIGARVYVYPGARIGQEGFSFASTKAGFLTIPQLGRVILEDDVEIGANSTIDRGSTGDTVIGAGSRVDNLVQIGHNVRLGRCCVIVAQVGIAGSTVFEDFVQVGGQAAIAGHLHIEAGAKIGAQSGVMADVPAGITVQGTPAQPQRDFFKQVAILKRIMRTYSPRTKQAPARRSPARTAKTAKPQRS
jgi:UDP-3-O-[3-hydroxymyristoyl] glucosamine N-acyltransferase